MHVSLIVYPSACPLKLEDLLWSNNAINLLECTLFGIEA